MRARLEPSPTRTICAYKGYANYHSARIGDELVADLAWSYEEPLSDAKALEGYVAFFDESVDVVLDGVPQKRPVTPWS